MIGLDIGSYQVLARLGEGGMGEVYRARDTRLGRDVALKVLTRARHEDAESRTRFEREARTLAALNDSHIASIYDIVDVGNVRAIVMELVEGRTLADAIASGRIPLRLAIGYAIDVSAALGVAHAAGIIHRDLKPNNVIITPTGSAKALDFGIAKLAASIDPAAMDQSTLAPVTGRRTATGSRIAGCAMARGKS